MARRGKKSDDYEKHPTKFVHIFSNFGSVCDGTPNKTEATQHIIGFLLEDRQPVHSRPYQAGTKARKLQMNWIAKILQLEAVEPAPIEWVWHIALVPKKDGRLRFCVEYRKLNAVAVHDSHHIPRMDEFIGSLGDATISSTLDTNSSYW